MSKADWASKDRRISRQGLIQSTLISVSHLVAAGVLPKEEMFKAAEILANKALAFVEEK